MCVKILEAAGKLNVDEYQFFLKGGIVLDRENQMDNPCSNWLADRLWDNITELAKLANFHGIIESFEQYPRDWHTWFQSAEPEVSSLPGKFKCYLYKFKFLNSYAKMQHFKRRMGFIVE
jgi:dynein heavy chain, axonemal